METLIITGPGGIGKSPLDTLIKDEVIRIEPYRLRKKGPRDDKDKWYANPILRRQLESMAKANGDSPMVVTTTNHIVLWYPKMRFAQYLVRGEYQLLIIPDNTEGSLIKMEVYAPVLPALLSIESFAEQLGEVRIIILNPSQKSVMEAESDADIASLTYNNCINRDRNDTVTAEKRRDSVAEEIDYWRELIECHGAEEFRGWEFSEDKWEEQSFDKNKVKARLLEENESLERFLR